MGWPKPRKSARQAGMEHGWRSGLEEALGDQLKQAGVPFQYEGAVLPFLKPSKASRYTPDYILPNGIVLESKGRFLTADRQKHLLIQAQHPQLDLRFIFSNPTTRISKQSRTTYAAWCHSNGFLYAHRRIPQEWLNEPPDSTRLAAIERFLKGSA